MRTCQRIKYPSRALHKVCSTSILPYNARSSTISQPIRQNPGSSHSHLRAIHLDVKRKASSQTQNNDTTIYALSTAPGRAAIAIIRISGPACLNVYRALCPGKSLPKARYANVQTLYDPTETEGEASVLDTSAIVFYFPAPNSATGEDVLELHVHGGTAVVKAILAAVSKAIPKGDSEYIRYAEPGEFTRRAFYNNRLDLLQVEALGDTLSADTEQQRRLAVRGSTSGQAHRYESWRQQLLHARGELEALIDFSEDQHFDESPAQLCASVAQQVQQLSSQLLTNIENASRGELLRDGINIALVGVPNAGKSSLLNQIVGREAAIVSTEAGTTRDIVDVNIDIGGYFCRFGDLAGLRKESLSPGASPVGEIEKEGMRRAKNRAFSADIVIAVLPAVVMEGCLPQRPYVNLDHEVLEVLDRCDPQKIVYVLNKADLFTDQAHLSSEIQKVRQLVGKNEKSQPSLYAVSCKNEGNIVADESDPRRIQAFLDGLIQIFQRMTSAIIPEDQQVFGKNAAWSESLGATERQRVLLQQCVEHLESFLTHVQPKMEYDASVREEDDEEFDVVLAAESLRSAADCLAKITGKGESGDVEEVLGVVFEK